MKMYYFKAEYEKSYTVMAENKEEAIEKVRKYIERTRYILPPPVIDTVVFSDDKFASDFELKEYGVDDIVDQTLD